MQRNRNTISVVIPCFNGAAFVSQAIESVLAQTCLPQEIVVVDDGSTDDSYDIAAAYGEPVRVVRQENRGECAARNRGIEAVQGEWIAFLDADDLWQPTKLERQLAETNCPDRLVCVHTATYNFGDAVRNGRQVCKPIESVLKGQYDVESLILEPMVTPSTAMIRRDVEPRFPVGVAQGGDMLFFAELSWHGRFAYVPEPLVGYRQHANQVTGRSDAWVCHFQNRFRWVDEHQDRLGIERADRLRAKLRDQILSWLQLAKWNRQWGRFTTLRLFARDLQWDGGMPAPLTDRLWPKGFYRAKDVLDRLLGRGLQGP